MSSQGAALIYFLHLTVLQLALPLTRLWRGPEISVIQGDHSDTRPGDLRVWLHEITMTS